MKKISWIDSDNNKHSGVVLVSKDGYDVIDCEQCGFKHITPLFSQEEVDTFYSEEFYQNEIETYIKSHQKDSDWSSIEHNEKLNFFEKNLLKGSSKKILDIGSGPGFFLKAASEKGWDVLGFEPGLPAFEFSTKHLGLNVVKDFFNEETYDKYGKFDVVHLNNVLEHLLNPIEILKLAHKILLPNGIICITSPNDFNPLQLMAVDYLKKEPWWVVPRHHINYFNSSSLKVVLERTQFKFLYETTSFPLEFFMFMGDDYINNPKVGSKIHSKRVNLEKSFSNANNTELKRKIYDKFCNLEIGREITVFYRKK